jgi:hypothetical protein
LAVPPAHPFAGRDAVYPADLSGQDFIAFCRREPFSVKLHAPDLVRPVGIVHRKRKKFNCAAQAFLDLLVGERPATNGHAPVNGVNDVEGV